MRAKASHAIVLVFAFLAAGCVGGSDVSGTPNDAGAGEFFLTGLVVDTAFVPVEGATVIADDGELTATTGTAGNFTLGPLQQGQLTVTVEARGYESVSKQVGVPYDADRLVFTLTPTSTDVPYHETLTFVGFYECMLAAKYPTGNPTWPCMGVVDLITGQNVSNDVWIFRTTIENPGFQGLLAEMTWEEQATAKWMAVSIRNEGLDETGALTYFYNRSLPNLRHWVYAGETNPGGDDVFYPEPNETVEYVILTQSATDPGQEVDFQLWLSHRSTLYGTFFYHRLGSDLFSALPDE